MADVSVPAPSMPVDEHNNPTLGGSSESEGEQETRSKLQRTSLKHRISEAQHNSEEAHDHPLSHSVTAESASSDDQAPRPRKKRSFDDLQHDTLQDSASNGNSGEPEPISSHHKRMRSRDVANGEYVPVSKPSDAPSPLEEEHDVESQKSPGGPGVLVEAPLRDSATPPPVSDPSNVTSPKKKRSRDQLDRADSHTTATGQIFETEPEKKRHRDEPGAKAAHEALVTKNPPKSAFANASTSSPFGATSSQKSPTKSPDQDTKPTSKTAFASSGLFAFASSSKSPFGSAGVAGSSGGGFGGASPSTFAGPPTSSPPKTGLGNTGATSPFASNRTTGFGSLGGGFGSSKPAFGSGFGKSGLGGDVKPFGGGLSSFASPDGTSSSFGGPAGAFGGATTKRKPFGAAEQSDEEGSDEDNSHKEDADDDEEHHGKSERLHRVEANTGEENESTIFSCRAKLYHFEDKQWKERGVGTIKLNEAAPEWTSSPTESESDKADADAEGFEDTEAQLLPSRGSKQQSRKARLIMRQDGVHRVILNTPVLKGLAYGTADGKEPSGKQMSIQGIDEAGKSRLFIIKIGKEDVLKDLWRHLRSVQEHSTH